jgi:transcriptional regulator with XRE-family HTH domain
MAEQRDLEALGGFVRQCRKELGLTQTALARRLGWTQERVSVLENGKYGLPSLPHLSRLAAALAVPLSELLRHVGVEDLGAPPHQEHRPEAGRQGTRLATQMAGAFDTMQSLEARLHTAEGELTRAETLTASIRAQRQTMAKLLENCRDR